jgi:LmbE family N-acetylglucosaminyl deacetylase
MGTLAMSDETAENAAAEDGDRLIAGQGTPEAVWQAWDGIGRLPSREAGSLVPPGCRVVVLSPHPDDEVLGCGGVLATLAAMDREILVVGVTDGDASHPQSKTWTPQTLAEARRDESAAGLQMLGIDTPSLRLGFDDGTLQLHGDELIAALNKVVQPNDVVFAPWRLDGHPDHEAVGDAASIVCERIGARLIEMPIWMWHWAAPDDARVPWSDALRIGFNPGVRQLKQAAIACHRSQLVADDAAGTPPVLADWALARWMRSFEVFFVV